MGKCFNCGSNTETKMYEIPICDVCKSELRLFTDETIIKQKTEYNSSPKYASYKDEISDRLLIVEKDFRKKKIKLLHILERLDIFK